MKNMKIAGIAAAAAAIMIAATACGSSGTSAKTTAAASKAAVQTTAPATTAAPATAAPTTAAPAVTTTAPTTAAPTTAAQTTAAPTTAAKTTAAAKETKAAGSGKSASQIYDEALKAASRKDIMQMPAQYVLNTYGLDMQAYPDSFFAVSEDATSAETIIFVRGKNDADASSIASTLQMVLDQKAMEMENYIPAQYQIVKKSKVRKNGNAVYLVISENESAIVKVIESGL